MDWERFDIGLCWEWKSPRTKAGYGVKAGKYVHRLVWELLVGPIPPGLVMDHLCRNRACANPDHLEPVTDAINIARGYAGVIAGQQRAARTHCPHGHEFTEENTQWSTNTRNGKPFRQCRPCKRKSDKKRVIGEAERERRRQRERERRRRLRGVR